MTTLVVGGAASGKSEYAEGLAERAFSEAGRDGQLWYIATMAAYDDESLARIAKHRDRRADKGYETVECPTSDTLLQFAGGLAPEDTPVLLLDDVGNLVANELFGDMDGAPELLSQSELEACLDTLVRPLKQLDERAGTLILVSNDIFGEPAERPADPGMENYRNLLSGLNRAVASFAENVCEVTAGLPDYYKGGKRH